MCTRDNYIFVAEKSLVLQSLYFCLSRGTSMYVDSRKTEKIDMDTFVFSRQSHENQLSKFQNGAVPYVRWCIFYKKNTGS